MKTQKGIPYTLLKRSVLLLSKICVLHVDSFKYSLHKFSECATLKSQLVNPRRSPTLYITKLHDSWKAESGFTYKTSQHI